MQVDLVDGTPGAQCHVLNHKTVGFCLLLGILSRVDWNQNLMTWEAYIE